MKKKALLTAMAILFCILPLVAGCSLFSQEKGSEKKVVLSTNNEQPGHQTGSTSNTLPVSPPAPDKNAQPQAEPEPEPDHNNSAGPPEAPLDKNNGEKTPEEAEQPPQAPPSPGSNNKNIKTVYLTFDDGPNSHFTEKVLGILDKEQVKASFMVIGTNVLKNSELIKQMVAQGHTVANHTYSHDYQYIYGSPENFMADLEKNREILKSLTGKDTLIFRAPGGPARLTKPYWDKLQEKGYKSISWNITGGDSDPAGVTPEQVYNNVASGLDKVEKAHLTPIVLLHDGSQLSSLEAKPGTATYYYIQSRNSVVTALPDIIHLFKEKGYTFVTVDENTPNAW
ncbi:peptidoglycan N-acetylglucosamine deacetylase [Desulfocucumis palustris]|uniref:Peptidoglycan N-acetylglucosamine deacetylase n=1 Tax=Desulfocucumis palustris TaxID=1898651 RepID=A0A2L2XDD9_9FIRM|nr:polysaccharide deacetylase family protein [Desulfocucumis palustris]GBF32246.1 peptidoglycan N-acetylglucosamine deacetylase [Desulfocucumis palustris]